MLNKLTLQNARRSSRDYFIYIITMTIVSTLMFALNGMIFSEDMKSLYSDMLIFTLFVGLASFFIVIIIIWMIHYMVNFMMERRSREFGTYLLLGMKKKQISAIFRKENLLLGFLSLLLGIIPGTVVQIAFINIFYSVFKTPYKIHPEFSFWNLLITFGLFLLSYTTALLRVKKNFKKMNIRDLMYADKQNEELIREKGTWKKMLTLLSIAYILVFNVLVLTGSMTILSAMIYIAGLIAAIYFLYIGLSSVFVSYIQKQRKSIYKDANLFIFRQLSAKIKTMRFTMGTLTILFTTALFGWMVVMMFADYQNGQVSRDLPIDIMVFSDQPDDTFDDELEIIRRDSSVEETHIYQIYTNQTVDVNNYLLEHIDGTWEEDQNTGSYFLFDTYISLSDYNRVRIMSGYEPVSLSDTGFIIQCKERVKKYMDEVVSWLNVSINGTALTYQETFFDPMTQNGMNGADYLIVVPDRMIASMQPHYSLLAVNLKDSPPSDLQSKLEESQGYYDELGYPQIDIRHGHGSSQILSYTSPVLVAETTVEEMSFVVISMCFFLAYIGIIFLCAALTILAVQQLSDSGKYQFRYHILKQLGVSKKETDRIVLKQLGVYYLCPFVISIILSMFIGMFASERFVYYTGVHASIFQFYLMAVLVFAVLYLAYFFITYIGFLRNIHN